MSTNTMKITRRGFRSRKYPVPADVLAEAEERIAATAEVTPGTSIMATLRPSVYCGPGSAGDRGAYTLEILTFGDSAGRCSVLTIEHDAEAHHAGEHGFPLRPRDGKVGR